MIYYISSFSPPFIPSDAFVNLLLVFFLWIWQLKFEISCSLCHWEFAQSSRSYYPSSYSRSSLHLKTFPLSFFSFPFPLFLLLLILNLILKFWKTRSIRWSRRFPREFAYFSSFSPSLYLHPLLLRNQNASIVLRLTQLFFLNNKQFTD